MAYPLSAPFHGSYGVNQGYGPTMSGFEFAGHGYPPRGQNFPLWHSGIDFDTPSGTQMYAMADGTVIHASLDEYAASYNGSYGLVLRIAYDNGYISLYAHQSSIEVTVNQRVVQGQPVSHSGGAAGPGLSGPNTNSGNSSGPHLHFEIRNHGGGYGSDINPSGVVDFGSQAAQTAPTPPMPRGTPAGNTGGPLPGNTGSAGAQGIPVGPELAVETMPLRRVRPYATELSSLDPARQQPIMACEIDGVVFPVSALHIETTAYRAPGSFQVTLPLALVSAVQRARILDVLLTHRRTQVILHGGYVANVLDAQAGDLLPLFTGFVETPRFSYDGPTQHLALAGPDLSGLLSTPSATESNLEQFANMTASDVARIFATRHNLDVAIDATADQLGGLAHIGSYYDGNTLKTRRAGQTEWDILTQLATNEGFVVFCEGTTLRFGRVPDPLPTQVDLRYQVQGEPAGPVTAISIDAQPHSQRDYAVVVQSYDTRSKQATQGKAGTSDQAAAAAGPFTALLGTATGNPDSLQVVTITEPPNTPQKALDAKARAVFGLYQSTEYIVTATIKGCLPLTRFTPVVIVSDTVHNSFTTKGGTAVARYYVAHLVYDYTPAGGLTQTVTATTLPYGAQSTTSAPVGAGGF